MLCLLRNSPRDSRTDADLLTTAHEADVTHLSVGSGHHRTQMACVPGVAETSDVRSGDYTKFSLSCTFQEKKAYAIFTFLI